MGNSEKDISKSLDPTAYTSKRLYYDLGYSYADNDDIEIELGNDYSIFLFAMSLILQFLLGINQIFTILLIFLFVIQKYTFNKNGSQKQYSYFLIGIFIANVLDHISAGIVIPVATLFSERLNFFSWVFEIAWVMFFGLQFLSVYQPNNSRIDENKTLTPVSEEAKEEHKMMKKRLSSSEFELREIEEDIDITLLAKSFTNLIKFLILILVLIILTDFLIWSIISGLSGGNNLYEAYFVSGIAMIIFIILLGFVNLLFSNNKE